MLIKMEKHTICYNFSTIIITEYYQIGTFVNKKKKKCEICRINLESCSFMTEIFSNNFSFLKKHLVY